MSKQLAKAVTVNTDPKTGQITQTVVTLQNGVRVDAPGPIHLTVGE